MEPLALVEDIPGWLRPEDAEALYELARDSPGPVLEIGTYQGKSAVLMALARAGRDGRLYTLDVDPDALRAAAAAAEARGVADRILFVRGTLAAFARAHPHVRPALTFVDGDHSRAGVERDLAVLEALVPAGGRMLFHDFHDPLNDDPCCDSVAVRPAVEASWVARECEFDGVFGCCGPFTRRHGEPLPQVAIADLLALEGARDQLRHRIRRPAGRLRRRLRAYSRAFASTR